MIRLQHTLVEHLVTRGTMDLAEIFRVMRRRWYVLLPGLLLTAGLVFGVTLVVHVTYQSQSTVVLLNSQKATVAYDGNPFLSTQTSLTGMADSLARNLNSDDSLRGAQVPWREGHVRGEARRQRAGAAAVADRHRHRPGLRAVLGQDPDRLRQGAAGAVPAGSVGRLEGHDPYDDDRGPADPGRADQDPARVHDHGGWRGLVLTLVAVFYVEARRRPRRPGAPASPDLPDLPDEEESTTVPVVEETLAIRRPPSWSQAAEQERAAKDGQAAAQPREPRPVMAGASAAEPRDEESTHGHRPRTGQRDR